ncbi:hypothetical protein [Marinobacter confluentis]|uniref:PEP-CTERM sorting domain-containing protein n=1 Tax=Marinobacter confluentis TaxID=1697557 RepID=A0A4Z1BU63_9GAMM|nr:hypothetical protein [Marinobacter confluentis]TGN41635.1 hypothetical protein E5Q11_03655 [Marinobacter confluentis]
MKTFVCMAALALPASALGSEIRFVGTATPIDGGDALYQESHVVTGSCQQGQFNPESHSVEYTRSNEGAFATKDLSYTESALRPTVDFRQPGFSETLDINNRDDETLEIIWQAPSGSTEEATLNVSSSLVADAGFDNFVRQNWKTVVENGESVEFEMVAPTRGDYYGFTLEPASDDRIDADHVVRIRTTSRLLGFLVDPIVLGYNSDGLLTDYLGLTNIRENEDANFTAHIRYDIEAMPECELTP